MNYGRVPLKDVTASPLQSFNRRDLNECGVLIRDGIFYASLKLRDQENPMLVALHGVNSEHEAREAFATLVTLRQSDCGCETPDVGI